MSELNSAQARTHQKDQSLFHVTATLRKLRIWWRMMGTRRRHESSCLCYTRLQSTLGKGSYLCLEEEDRLSAQQPRLVSTYAQLQYSSTVILKYRRPS